MVNINPSSFCTIIVVTVTLLSSLSIVFAFKDHPNKGPWFEEEPADSFLVRSKSVILKCKAYDVLQVWFECNSGQQEDISKRESEHYYTDPETGKRIIEKSLNVTKNELEEFARSHPLKLDTKGDQTDSEHLYLCWCVAYGDTHRIQKHSRKASVQFSYVRRNFINDPIRVSVEIGSEARFSCSLPEGFSKPTIYWLKNGKLIRDGQISAAINQLHRNDKQKKSDDVNSIKDHEMHDDENMKNSDDAENESISINNEDSNYKIMHDGTLVIRKARISDHANFSCAAANHAGVRHSQPIILTLYVNGSWSDWSPWSNCSAKCGRGVQKRYRECSSLPAINGVSDCIGESVQVMDCITSCSPIDGQWSPWSTWTSCSHDCQQSRHRTCTNPSPKYGGLECFGSDIQFMNCTSGLCRRSVSHHQFRHHDEINDVNFPRSSTSQVNGQSEMYILCTAIVISTGLLCLAGFIFMSMRHRRCKNHSSYADERGEDDGHAMLLLMQKNQQPPDLIHKANTSLNNDCNSNGNLNVPTTGEKMYLISRLNNYYSNILDHVVVSSDSNIATSNSGVKSVNLETVFYTSNTYPSNNCVNLVTPTKHAPNTSIPSVAGTSTSTATGPSDDDNDSNEPDYAEPMIPEFPVTFTPDRKPPPPLPPNCPPPSTVHRSRLNNTRLKSTDIIT